MFLTLFKHILKINFRTIMWIKIREMYNKVYEKSTVVKIQSGGLLVNKIGILRSDPR